MSERSLPTRASWLGRLANAAALAAALAEPVMPDKHAPKRILTTRERKAWLTSRR